jgi:hypothetical protein
MAPVQAILLMEEAATMADIKAHGIDMPRGGGGSVQFGHCKLFMVFTYSPGGLHSFGTAVSICGLPNSSRSIARKSKANLKMCSPTASL